MAIANYWLIKTKVTEMRIAYLKTRLKQCSDSIQ
uniref:Uncharacterized protein n=1 Tax=Anguilla anguilla TaxID=7936 RepID=A0A0E9S405_ANGAN